MIVPSKGRPTLARALASIAAQIEPGDELLVVCNRANDWGNSARQEAIDKATRTHLVFLDDDDVFVPGAFASMRSWAAQNPKRVGIFNRRGNTGSLQWTEPVLRRGSVAPPNFLIPNVPGKVARFGPQSQDPRIQAEIAEREGEEWSDSFFVRRTAELLGSEPVFVNVTTTHARPEENRLRRLRYRVALRTRMRSLLRR